MHVHFNIKFMIRTMKERDWAMFCEILGWFEQFRVRVSSMAAGVREERRIEREREQKNEKSGPVPFYIGLRAGSVQTRPILPLSWPFDLGPSRSGSIQCPWGALVIRIRWCVGLGFLPAGWGLLSVFLIFFLLYTPLILVIWTPMHAKISCKFPGKL